MEQDQLLFATDQYDREQHNSNEPVVCLGMTFANDEERRVYFREELRKKLPELKSIEGFPIGEDDDIINLSDPPYYTACPNPWLNDFVAEWEREKVELEANGERSTDFEVTTPYASDVSEGKNNPIYMAHAYHTKVPHPAIMRYILHYTQPGDIVFDGFCGTGMTGVAAQLCGSKKDVEQLRETDVKVGVRHAICSDLSPIASLIASAYNLKFDVKLFSKKANAVLEQVESELGWMYETEVNGRKAKINYAIWSDVYACPTCGHEMVLWEQAVDIDNNTMIDTFACPHCMTTCNKKNMEKVHETYFDSILGKTISIAKKSLVRINYIGGSGRGEQNCAIYDKELLSKIESINLQSYRTSAIPKGDEVSRNEKDGISHIHHFYTKRNFIYLSRVNELVKGDIFLQAWLTSVLLNVSKMYKFRLDRKGSMLYGTYFIPSYNVEFNPQRTLAGKLRDFCSIDYFGRGSSAISLNSATSICNLPDNSVDYIFTDPPFGANLMYSELSSIWEGWLSVLTNNKEEAIINNVQNKTLFEYQALMNLSFKEYYRVLKPGKWLTIEFSNTSASVWNSIQNALQGVGFIVVNVAGLDKKQVSFKAITTTTAVKQDLVITCFKPSDEMTNLFESSENTSLNVWDFVEELLEHLPVHMQKEHTTTAVVERSPKILYDRMIAYYVQHNYPVPMNAAEFQKGLRDHFVERDGMYFTATQVVEYEDKKSKTSDFQAPSLFVSSEADGITWIKNELKDHEQTYSELQPKWMQAMVAGKKGDQIPELMQILEENFIKNEAGVWHNPDPENEADLERVRTRKLLHEFAIYVETAQKPKAKIKEARLEALRCGFKQCYKDKDFATIMAVSSKLPESLLTEDEVLLQYYDIASMRV